MDGTLTTPLELLGSHAGLSVVDPGTILTRLWYFDGKFLRAAGFRLDQEYVRSLVALSNQATGTGVVHGFDVARASGDRLRIEGGLALAPSGRVVYLPQRVELGIAELIARSTGSFDPSTTAEPGVADFSRCPPDAAVGPDVTVAPQPLYVLTVSGIEALCGEEERFGQLCEDACATETDRSKVVEGVAFRVRQLNLTLPTSIAVPAAGQHLRSRVATAFFELERRAVGSMISGAGLRNPVWCAAADGIGGEEVPLAVFDRSGAVTSFVDAWTARRELMETSPQRYWAQRMAMRPWDVFLAQVLQFQCQLLDLGSDGAGGGVIDPCAGEREALAAVDDVLQRFTEPPAATTGDRISAAFATLSPDAFTRIEAVRAKIGAALAGGRPATSGSVFVNGGFWTVPAAGYVPIRKDADVAEQLRALFGPGVDLRFCAVRPDFVPEALLEAQHMERISLTRGLDDPDDLEEVDVLVPGGVIDESAGAAVEAFTGVARIQPRVRTAEIGVVKGSALSLSVVARSTTGAGWSWTAAAYGEAAQRVSVPDLLGGTLSDAHRAFAGEEGEGGEDTEISIRPDAEHDRRRATSSFTQRLVREARLASDRKARIFSRAASSARPAEAERDAEADRPLADDEDRPVAIWLDGETGAALDTLATGAMTDVRMRTTLYSRAATSPVLADLRLTGTLRVVDVTDAGSRKLVRTVLDGVADVFRTGGDPDLVPVRAFPLTWGIQVEPTGARVLAVLADDPVVGSVRFTDADDPRHILGEAMLRTATGFVTEDWRPAADLGESFIGPAPGALAPIASLELDEQAGALAAGAPGRTVAESVIAVIAAALAVPGRDPGFAAYATTRLLGGAGGPPTRRIRATDDWVLFHRRRTRVCADEVVERAVRTRTYRLYHRHLDGGDLRPFDALRGRWVRDGDAGFLRASVATDDLGFEPVATLEFPEDQVELITPASVLRTAWQGADRGDTLLLGAVGDLGEGDGESVALGRLATVRTAVSGLIDTAGARLEHLLDVPPEFREPGLDGVVFTVGTTRVERTCLTLYRLRRDEHARVLDNLRELGETVPIEEVVRRSDVNPDIFTVELADGQVVQPEALRAQWEQFETLSAVLALPSSTGEVETGQWRQRAGEVLEVVGHVPLSDDVLPVRTEACPSVLLVAAHLRIG